MTDLMDAADDPYVGTCRQCGAPDPGHIVMLGRRCLRPGEGWGCFTCSLPMDGAVTILCDACWERFDHDENMIWFAVDGRPAENRRVRIRCLPAGEFDHNLAAHALDQFEPARWGHG